MFKNLQRGPNRPPRSRLDPNPACTASVFAIRCLLRQIGSHDDDGRPPELALWDRFFTGEGPPPIKPELSGNPEMVGQLVASFIKNNDRRQISRQHGRDHEIRSALGETVGSLSTLVTDVSMARTEANAVLNQLADFLEAHPENDDAIKGATATLSELRSILRRLDACADEKRRTVNSRLANLRMELLDLPAESATAFRTPRSAADLEEYLQRFAEAARQLGESLTLVTIGASRQNEHLNVENVLVSVAESINNCFQREVDFIARLGSDRFVAILIDTPEAAIRSLLSRLRVKIEDDFPGLNLSEHLDVCIEAVNTDSTSRALDTMFARDNDSSLGFVQPVDSQLLSIFVAE